MSPSGPRLTVVFYGVLIVLNLSVNQQGEAQSKAKPAPVVIGNYVGAGSCAAAACHGDVSPHFGKPVKQTEYGTWILQDPHARAYQSLENQVSLRMATILKLDKAPIENDKCLSCHALAPPAAKKERDFSKREGVSCEMCHGPASGWLESHIRENSTEQSVICGMSKLKDIEVRTMKCLECHLGTKDKEVDHKMIAAGHPDLLFQLELYSAKQPPHWRLPDDPHDGDVKAKDRDSSYGVRLWTIGQAVQLREALDRLERRATRSRLDPNHAQWPEFSEYDCFSCHHPISKPEISWRQERDCNLIAWINKASTVNCSPGNGGGSWPGLDKGKYDNPLEHDRVAGLPQWNTAHYSVLLILAQEVDPNTTDQLRPLLTQVYTDTKAFRPPDEVEKHAREAKEKAALLVTAIRNAKFDYQQVFHLMDRISASADMISFEDTRSGEQAWMALDSLLRCYQRQLGFNEQKPAADLSALRTALDNLYSQFNSPSTYSGPRFASAMHGFNDILNNRKGVATAARSFGHRTSQSRVARKLQIGQAHATN